ncbi:MAG TPA: universal stress protein [Microbacteriaceae bacterium]
MHTVVVGWDRSTASNAALEWALNCARTAKIVLVQVTDADVSTDAASSPGSPSMAALAAVHEDLARLREDNSHLTIDAELVSGDAVEELARFSNETTLVVVGTDRQQGGGIRYRWSVGAKLAATAHGPIAVVPTGRNVNGGDTVVGIDGSAASVAALEFAASEAIRTGGTLHAVLAWQEPPVWVDATVPDAEYLRSLEKMYAELLDDSLAVLASNHPRLEVRRSLVRGPAATVLLNAAETARMLVVGNHGRRGVARLLLGSVSRSLVANTPCPVVVVRAR